MRVQAPSIFIGAVFRPSHDLPNKEGDPAPAQRRLLLEGKTFTVTAVRDVGDHTEVTLSDGTRTLTYGAETLIRGFSAVA